MVVVATLFRIASDTAAVVCVIECDARRVCADALRNLTPPGSPLSIEAMPSEPSFYLRSRELLSRTDSRLLVVDVQEKLVPLIPVRTQLIANCRRLIEGAKILGVPVTATEQYPKGLGATVPELAELIEERPAKQRFSCAEVLNWGQGATQSDGRFKVVLCGMETHVCIQQTALDLIAQGFQLYVVADAVGCRNAFDGEIALERMASSGATITTTESVLFEWCETSGAEEFKQFSRMIKQK